MTSGWTVVISLLALIVASLQSGLDRTDYFKCVDQVTFNVDAEQHYCIDYYDDNPSFIRGTYAMVGYFEGTITAPDSSAIVAWYESSANATTPIATGIATLQLSGTNPLHSVTWKGGAGHAASGLTCNLVNDAVPEDLLTWCLWTSPSDSGHLAEA
eukprot:CAMPEP_0113667628 /NCGR_PEP_ID=MMETSP0038_2-20120614/3546_1 /TAXON_ID=2898 /ORGANISM="Cryptomonas paramecium" /LENGTH=155 /DNA_ID=CAMNT_0000583273 /DNA_START=66 /DNA_END=529 /DNA_ORIENTATION=- /assembly_acc=CAM_ASM_000170